MTFEEFFGKKKIDLAALKRAKPDLYEEFHAHYRQMGEKSFDHTKKFWFNRLRKDYLLKDEEVPAAAGKPAKDTVPDAEKTAASATAGGSATKPTGFKPRFKAATAKPDTEDPPKADDMPGEPKKHSPPAGFKPRFKAANSDTPPAEKPIANKETTEPTKGTEAPAKPLGFKPRFKADNMPPANSDEPPTEKPAANNDTTDTGKGTDTPAKPLGFKPRFKPGIPPEAGASKPTGEQDMAPKEDMPKESHEKDLNQPDKPLGFKPRFKPGITKPKKD